MSKYIDLSHTLHDGIPAWNLSCGFHQRTSIDYEECKTDLRFRVQEFSCPAGIGTHMYVPAHCFPGTMTIDQFPIEQCRQPCVVLDVSASIHENYVLSVADIENFEKQYGLIPNDTLVIVYTGWSQYWNTPKHYHNQLVFPSVSVEAAVYLLKRNISGLGIDTLSPDAGNSHFGVHEKLLSANKYIIENIAHAELLPAVGADVMILPLKIENGTEAPVRLVGIIK